MLGTISTFLDFFESYASFFNTRLPILTEVNRFLTVANLVINLFSTGADCLGGDVSPVLFGISLFLIFGIALSAIVSAVSNPILGFIAGQAVSQVTNILIREAQNCAVD